MQGPCLSTPSLPASCSLHPLQVRDKAVNVKITDIARGDRGERCQQLPDGVGQQPRACSSCWRAPICLHLSLTPSPRLLPLPLPPCSHLHQRLRGR